eukprot:TRINITY_DN32363_c0_g1_i1.p1 TRINITY_DN32363_c0_g1~~TRINITY_DN32363_c0_g1_i1.p1  ORF type:complete len:317 (-),score=48.99 TRINITY_DN32363_c0_g1_i1:413-1363(-)
MQKISEQPLPALAQLGLRIKESKHQLSKEEMVAFVECNNRVTQKSLEGALFAFSVAYPSLYRLRYWPRAFFTTAATLVGGFANKQRAWRPCIDHILTLEGSPVRGEMIAILERDFPRHPSLKAVREQARMVGALSPTVFSEDGRVGHRLPPKKEASDLHDARDNLWGGTTQTEKGEKAENRQQHTGEREMEDREARISPEHEGTGGSLQRLEESVQSDERASSAKASKDNTAYSNSSQSGGSVVEDPFYFPPLFDTPGTSGSSENSGSNSRSGGRDTSSRGEVRSSRLTGEERRQHNRQRYLEWQRKEREQAEQRT